MMYTQDYRGPPPGHAQVLGQFDSVRSAPPPGPPMGHFESVRGAPPPGPPMGPGPHNPYGPPPTMPTEGSQFNMRGSVRAPSVAPSGFDRDRDGYRDGAVGYRCRFLGSKSMGVAEPQPDMVGEVVDSLIKYYKNTEVQPRRYLIRIRSAILELEELENDEVHIQNVPLDAITFCASDNRYERIFTFVARAESGYMCHVFYCRHIDDVDRLTRDFDDAFRNCYAEWQQGSKVGTVNGAGQVQGITDPTIVQAVETALKPRPSRYRANVKEIVMEEQPRSLPLYNFQGQRVKSVRSRPATSGEPSSTRYIFAYEDDDDDDTVVQVRPQRKSHRYPVAKEQFRFDRGSSHASRREYRREYVVQGSQEGTHTTAQQPPVRREYVLTPAAQPSVRSAAPASYRTEFVAEHRPQPDAVEADGRAYNREFFEGGTRPVVIETTQPVPAADGPAVILEERDVGYGRQGYGSVHLSQVNDLGDGALPNHSAYTLHAASNNRSDMLY